MPWRHRPMKDGARAETFTGSRAQAKSRESPNGATPPASWREIPS